MTPMEHPSEASSKDRNTQLAQECTSLALKRSFLGAERTLMAWMRTASCALGRHVILPEPVPASAQASESDSRKERRGACDRSTVAVLLDLPQAAKRYQLVRHRKTEEN